MKNLSWYIAFRYFISKKSTQAVSIIMYTSLIAIAIAACAMFVILSVFSGLESFNIKLISDVNPDLKILPASGKTLPNIDKIIKVLSSHSDVEAYTKVIEEKVYVLFDEKDEIAYLKGVDENFLKVVKIDTCFQAGKFPDILSKGEAAFGNALAYRLGIPIDKESFSSLYMPKPGKGLLSNTDDAFEKTRVHMTGVFALNDQYENYIFVPIQISQDLLNLPSNSAFCIELKVKKNVKDLQELLKKELGDKYIILNRQEQDASFLKMMKVEQLFIYLIFILVIIIASFNLAGAIIIIILDKKYQSKSLISLGYSIIGLKKLFFTIGIIITIFGVLLGIILGTLLTWLQAEFALVMANPFMPFPVKFDTYNYLIVLFTVLFIGFLVSLFSSRKLNF